MNWNQLLALSFLLGSAVSQTTPFTTVTTVTTCPPSSHSRSRHSRSSHSRSSHSRSSHCPRPTHHSPCCPPKPCCETITKYTKIKDRDCCILIHPCPTNTTVMVTTTVTVAPTSAAVAPINLVVPACIPCTSIVTETVLPSLVCTTMIFCDIADQSENCRQQNELEIEKIAQAALRSGGQVFVNGQVVVFENSKAVTSVVSGSTLVTVTGLNANDAPASNAGYTLVSVLGAVLAGFFFV